MHCPECSRPLPAAAQTCPQCGASIAAHALRENVDQPEPPVMASWSPIDIVGVLAGAAIFDVAIVAPIADTSPLAPQAAGLSVMAAYALASISRRLRARRTPRC